MHIVCSVKIFCYANDKVLDEIVPCSTFINEPRKYIVKSKSIFLRVKALTIFIPFILSIHAHVGLGQFSLKPVSLDPFPSIPDLPVSIY